MSDQVVPTSEYHHFYKGYIEQLESPDLYRNLQEGKEVVVAGFERVPASMETYRYASGKWTPRDILRHIIDTERVFGYRALFIARASEVSLQGFDENEFANNAGAERRPLSNLLSEYKAVRASTLLLFKSFDEITLKRTGMANGHTLSVRAAGYIICGHERHHCQILKERYLS